MMKIAAASILTACLAGCATLSDDYDGNSSPSFLYGVLDGAKYVEPEKPSAPTVAATASPQKKIASQAGEKPSAPMNFIDKKVMERVVAQINASERVERERFARYDMVVVSGDNRIVHESYKLAAIVNAKKEGFHDMRMNSFIQDVCSGNDAVLLADTGARILYFWRTSAYGDTQMRSFMLKDCASHVEKDYDSM